MPDYESIQLQMLDKIGDISMDEFYHHGIKGMKWGVRRYQKADGSLTVLGRARQKIREASENRKAKKAAEAENERVRNLMKKPISKLSAEELKERTARAESERRLLDIERQSNELTKNGSTFAKKLGSKFLNEAAVPALVSAGKNVLTKKLEGMLSKALGLNVEDAVNSMDLLGKVDISKWTDAQVKAAEKRAEGILTIKKAKNAEKEVDGERNESSRADAERTIEKAGKDDSKPKADDSKPKADDSKPKADDSKPSNTFTPSNSNAKSVHDLFKETFPDMVSTKSTSVSDLYKSDYRMKSVDSGRSAFNELARSGWTMRSLDDLEKYS